jgi:xylulokinase
LPEGIAVAVGTGDDFATPLGGGLNAPGRVAAVLGTGEVVGALHPAALRDQSGLLETHAYPGGAFFIENPGWLSGGAVSWLSQLLSIPDLATLNALAAEAPAGADGLCFMPALTGAMAPEWRPAARGCFYGLTPAHGRGHMVRALLEGCAFAMRDVVDRLDHMGVVTSSLLLIGGGAHSRLWSQMRADLVQRTVELPHCIDSAPIGAALLAAVAGGMARSLDEAVRLLSVEVTEIEPDPRQAAAYDEAYGNYRRLFQSLKPLFTEQPRN